MERVLVVGAGFMGAGIAQVCAQAGYQVDLMDIDPAVTECALKAIGWSVEKLSAKGVLKESSQQVLARISTEKDLASAAQADWVIESVIEQEQLKRDIFQELDRLRLVSQ
jgi:3-hydroxybutyryl-CoA dehydrogenase